MKRFKRLALIATGLWSILLMGSALDAFGETTPATPPAATQPAVTEAAPAEKPKAKPRRTKRKIKRKVSKGVPLPAATATTPADKSGVQTWLKDLKKRLEKSRAKHNQIVAVAAVRGNETADAPPLYWKGKKASGPAQMPELAEFETAIDMALNGDPAARTKLSAFLAANPESALAPDAQETLDRLPAETATP